MFITIESIPWNRLIPQKQNHISINNNVTNYSTVLGPEIIIFKKIIQIPVWKLIA